MELFTLIVLDGTLLGAMALVPIGVISALRKKYLSGALLGATSGALHMICEWLWYSAFARRGETWIELALARAGAVEITILACGLLVTSVNVLLLIKQKVSSAPAGQN